MGPCNPFFEESCQHPVKPDVPQNAAWGTSTGEGAALMSADVTFNHHSVKGPLFIFRPKIQAGVE